MEEVPSEAGGDIAGLITFMRSRKDGGRFGRRAVATVLVPTIAAAGALAWTGLAGGRINHPELQQPGDLQEGPAAHHH